VDVREADLKLSMVKLDLTTKFVTKANKKVDDLTDQIEKLQQEEASAKSIIIAKTKLSAIEEELVT